MPENKPEVTKYRIRQGWDHDANSGTYAIEAKTPQSARFGPLSFGGEPAAYHDKELAEKALAVVLLRDKLARAEAEFAEAFKPTITVAPAVQAGSIGDDDVQGHSYGNGYGGEAV